MYETSRQSRFDARYWMLGAGALGRPRGMVWGGRKEEGSGWGTHVYLWRKKKKKKFTFILVEDDLFRWWDIQMHDLVKLSNPHTPHCAVICGG